MPVYSISLSTMPVYFISLFSILIIVSLRLEKIQRDFHWAGSLGKKARLGEMEERMSKQKEALQCEMKECMAKLRKGRLRSLDVYLP